MSSPRKQFQDLRDARQAFFVLVRFERVGAPLDSNDFQGQEAYSCLLRPVRKSCALERLTVKELDAGSCRHNEANTGDGAKWQAVRILPRSLVGQEPSGIVGSRIARDPSSPNGESSPLKVCLSPGRGENRNAQLRPRLGAVLIRIVKPPPAPLMDGFDVRDLRVHHTYDVDTVLGRYLVIAGYGEPVDDTALDKWRSTDRR